MEQKKTPAYRIGVIGAMDVEMEALKRMLREPESETISGVEFVSGDLAGHKAVLAVCGIGKVAAAVCAEAMILRYAPEMLVNIGVAGALTGSLCVGEMALGSYAVCHDMDTTPLGDEPGLISGLSLVKIPLDESMRLLLERACRDCGVRALSGGIASGDQFVTQRERKQWIVSQFGAIACEMEGQSIAQTAYVNGTPCAILRSISDGADGAASDYEAFKALAAARSTAVLRRFLDLLP